METAKPDIMGLQNLPKFAAFGSIVFSFLLLGIGVDAISALAFFILAALLWNASWVEGAIRQKFELKGGRFSRAIWILLLMIAGFVTLALGHHLLYRAIPHYASYWFIGISLITFLGMVFERKKGIAAKIGYAAFLALCTAWILAFQPLSGRDTGGKALAIQLPGGMALAIQLLGAISALAVVWAVVSLSRVIPEWLTRSRETRQVGKWGNQVGADNAIVRNYLKFGCGKGAVARNFLICALLLLIMPIGMAAVLGGNNGETMFYLGAGLLIVYTFHELAILGMLGLFKGKLSAMENLHIGSVSCLFLAVALSLLPWAAFVLNFAFKGAFVGFLLFVLPMVFLCYSLLRTYVTGRANHIKNWQMVVLGLVSIAIMAVITLLNIYALMLFGYFVGAISLFGGRGLHG